MSREKVGAPRPLKPEEQICELLARALTVTVGALGGEPVGGANLCDKVLGAARSASPENTDFSPSPENTERGQTRIGGRGDSPERQFVRLAAALHPKILILALHPKILILALHPNRFRALETL